MTVDEFQELLRGRRGGIKASLLDRKQMAGIGNVYVQDPLFKAGIHPPRTIDTLSAEEIQALYTSSAKRCRRASTAAAGPTS